MGTRSFVFEKALSLLIRPASLAALLLLAVNDHLLRRFWPTWWTGKLGDAAWLFFTPFALAAVLAWVTPGPKEQREQRVFRLAFVLTGLVFSLVKTLPAAHAALVTMLSSLFDTPFVLLRDPTDLLALPALALAWQLYRTSAAPKLGSTPSNDVNTTPLSAGRLTALALAGLLTIANMAQPNPGIACLSSSEQGLQAATVYQSYTSQDGGLTWQPSEGWPADCATSSISESEEWRTIAPTRGAGMFRYQSGQSIQRSEDGGQTWQVAFQPPALSDAGRAYLLKIHTGNAFYLPGPLDAVEDPQTGNLVFAMGYEGLLVYTMEGQWQWAAAGENRNSADFPGWESFWVLLGGEGWLALGVAMIVFAGLALRWLRAVARTVILIVGALVWLAVAWAFPPATTVGYGIVATGMGTLVAAIILIPLMVEMIFRLAQRRPGNLLPLTGFGLAAGLLFMLPYSLWAVGILRSYNLAALFGLLLAAATFAAGWRFFVIKNTPKYRL